MNKRKNTIIIAVIFGLLLLLSLSYINSEKQAKDNNLTKFRVFNVGIDKLRVSFFTEKKEKICVLGVSFIGQPKLVCDKSPQKLHYYSFSGLSLFKKYYFIPFSFKKVYFYYLEEEFLLPSEGSVKSAPYLEENSTIKLKRMPSAVLKNEINNNSPFIITGLVLGGNRKETIIYFSPLGSKETLGTVLNPEANFIIDLSSIISSESIVVAITDNDKEFITTLKTSALAKGEIYFRLD
ncbi:hypothetical protein COT75_01250 [Candidatus Beckwithbacteria bacterium CG10_big_fil_rev_8_21_14_0_10_34_10]|uniref:Uncharacterized protein n=1 Tax=Candidatus Beckwithbacteria bacterium CG10_big_fil_rev_8_21_14_0_10_34_10 TaxID=1974495 RepID=A0A2H0WA16_9BACT|nr:MAG: hypothetical protein COT75_01250 [Candidatus Beckwithbacteria bacterium CG10_big_fil_rev_8_21_14_0_10_34_10]